MDNKTLLNKPIRMTEYYFDTFVVGIHHSIPHLIADLLNKKEIANAELSTALPLCRADLDYFISLIDKKLSTLDIELLADLEIDDRRYWVNELGRIATIEINTYGRIRPETMEKLLCLSNEDFIEVMAIANRLTQRIIGLGALGSTEPCPLPENMPVVS